MPTNPENAPEPIAQQLLVALRRRWWLLVGCLVIGGGVAAVVAKTSTKQYTSTASLLFQESGLSQQLFGFSASSVVNPSTQSATDLALVTQPVVAEATAQVLHVPASTVAAAISADNAGETDLVTVSATTTSPAFAQRLVNEYAQQFIKYRIASDEAQVNEAIAELKGQITRLQAAGAPQSEISDLQTRLSQLDVLSSIQTGEVQLAQAGLLPTYPSSPKTKRDIGLGLIVGLLFGALGVALAERFDTRVRGLDDLATLGIPVLTTLPHLRSLSRLASAANGQAVAEREYFRRLRLQLQYFNVDNRVASVLVTSAQPNDGKSTLAWHLARESAVMNPGAAVLLIDADLRRPTLARAAGIPSSPGLTELLSSDMAPSEVIQHVGVLGTSGTVEAHVHVITSGGLAPNPYELLSSSRLRHLLHELEMTYDLIVIDAPPTSVAAETIPLMREVSGVLLVVRAGHTVRRSIAPLAEQLAQVQVRLLGLVMNDLNVSGQTYGGYYPDAKDQVDAVEPLNISQLG